MQPTARVELRVHGRVQGVGLRPWALRRARELGLAGGVRNDGDGVHVALEGRPGAIEAWLAALRGDAPAGAEVEALERETLAPLGEARFRILPSAAGGEARRRLPADLPVCEACLADLFDPNGRRHRYPFTHCVGCGPRASVLLALPWDRERTSLAAFPPCAECRREYEDPADRRFHAESIACPACGPRLMACLADGSPVAGDPAEAAAALLADGGVVALKGYGGFHLAVDARSEEAAARLRQRKARPSKPFAVLVPDLAAARALAELGPAEEALLAGALRAVVIAPRREPRGPDAPDLADAVAPGSGDLGLLLPCAPLHHLLLFAPGARPGRDAARLPALVFTSANRSGEPTEHDDAEARRQLGGVADLFLVHDRAVAQPCDDPVFRSAGARSATRFAGRATRSEAEPSGVPRPGPIPVRLSRATAPQAFRLPVGFLGADRHPALLALGGDLKAAPALAVGGEIQLGAHVGDLASLRGAEALAERAATLARLLGAEPAWIAHDLHPGYAGTRLARERAPGRTIAVQHHHAHAMACLVENGIAGESLALVLDGAGAGDDGTMWGGELLRADARGFTRLAHLEAVPQPGGDAAAREPWRMAAVWLKRAFPEGGAPRLAWHARRDGPALAVIERMAEQGVNAPLTSSAGRLFDAVASLLGCGDVARHEAEAATALESLAATAEPVARDVAEARANAFADAAVEQSPAFDCAEALREPVSQPVVIAAADLLREVALALARGDDRARIARRFHRALAARLAAAALAAARRLDLSRVALSGGCFQNRLLLADVVAALAAGGAEPLVHRRAPPNDGGLALGQAAIAVARIGAGRA
jgi:hydrogenase maturation protein HypF